MQADLQPGVAQRCNNAFRHLFGLLRSNLVIWTLYVTLANCSCDYRIHLMMVIHCFTPPLMYRYFLRWCARSRRYARTITSSCRHAPTEFGNSSTTRVQRFRHDFEHDNLVVHRLASACRGALGGRARKAVRPPNRSVRICRTSAYFSAANGRPLLSLKGTTRCMKTS